jgi:ribosome modulation factor
MTISDAFDEGYAAYWDGVVLEGNPYDQEKNADGFESWIKGWREARKHDYDESEG